MFFYSFFFSWEMFEFNLMLLLINVAFLFGCAAHNRHQELYRIFSLLTRRVTCISMDTAIRILRCHNGRYVKMLSVAWQWETAMEKPVQVEPMLICINICLSIIIHSPHNILNMSLNLNITLGNVFLKQPKNATL